MTKELYIHIGYPKCASTFLQKNVFPYMKEVNFIHKNPIGTYNDETILLSELKEGKNLISYEGLSGPTDTIDENYGSQCKTLRKLKLLYPDAKIILVKRIKSRWLKSLYKQFISHPVRANMCKDYDDWYENILNKNILNTDDYIATLEDTFESVLILDFGDLVINNDLFIQKICKFMQVSLPSNYNRKRSNVRLNDRQLGLIRLLGKLKIPTCINKITTLIIRKINE